jgi:hypothetical protein
VHFVKGVGDVLLFVPKEFYEESKFASAAEKVF